MAILNSTRVHASSHKNLNKILAKDEIKLIKLIKINAKIFTFACHIQRDPARRDGTYKTPLQQRKQTTNHRHRHKSKLKCTPPGRYLQHQPKTTNSSSNNNNSNTQQQRQLVKLFTSPPKFSLLIFCWFETTRKKNNSRHFSGCVAVEGGGVGGGWGGC